MAQHTHTQTLASSVDQAIYPPPTTTHTHRDTKRLTSPIHQTHGHPKVATARFGVAVCERVEKVGRIDALTCIGHTHCLSFYVELARHCGKVGRQRCLTHIRILANTRTMDVTLNMACRGRREPIVPAVSVPFDVVRRAEDVEHGAHGGRPQLVQVALARIQHHWTASSFSLLCLFLGDPHDVWSVGETTRLVRTLWCAQVAEVLHALWVVVLVSPIVWRPGK
mmetsp:Transcript_47530/g.118788  ORF Transcript_47530/g.118788 Transcript_47530/m.118788 type:complete len:223 (+) Transcript_47530:145-813(+)